MDLTSAYPRSPLDTLGGLVWLPRLIDKTRAHLAGTVGEYKFNCPIDSRFFQFFGIGPDAFKEAVKQAPDDSAVLQWVKAHSNQQSDEAIQEFNSMLSGTRPTKPDSQQRFAATLERLAPGRKDISTWFQLLDLEEGRFK